MPKGAAWYDFYTGKQYKGGETATIPAPVTRIPVLVRAGAIVPMDRSPSTSTSNLTRRSPWPSTPAPTASSVCTRTMA